VGLPEWTKRASGLLLPQAGFAYHPWRFQPCDVCCCRACSHYPAELTVSLADIINASEPDCTSCTNANDDWTIPLQTECQREVYNGGWYEWVRYKDEFEVDYCGANLQVYCIVYWRYLDIDERRDIWVAAQNANEDANSKINYWRTETSQSDPFDCTAFSSLDIPYLGAGTGPYCASPDSSCVVSA